MRFLPIILSGYIFLCLSSVNCFARAILEREIPAPATVGEELKMSMESNYQKFWKHEPKDAAEWKSLVQTSALANTKITTDLLMKLKVKCEKSSIAGVPVYLLDPPQIPDNHKDKILLFFHGGGYVFNPGKAGLSEGIYMAYFGKFRVIAVDYRLAPDFPYPAALEDAFTVYKNLLESYSSENIGIFGSSTGGGLTLALCLLAREEKLPMPGAIAPGTPWTDLTKTGDSYFTNDQLDNVLVSYEGLLESMAKAYANGHDLKDPLLSPIYGDLHDFPPTILGTGTRDLFLSNTVRTHSKLREAGVPADLLVIEGLSHYQYVLLPPDAPETRYYFTEVAKFFDKYLGKQ